MTIEIFASRKTKEVLIEIGQAEDRHKRALYRAWHYVGDEVTVEIARILVTGKRTGKMYRYKGRPHQASAEGEPPAKRSGKLSKSIEYRVRHYKEMRLGETVEHAKMEDNWGRIKARPHIIKAVKKKAQDTVNIIGEALNREIKR